MTRRAYALAILLALLVLAVGVAKVSAQEAQIEVILVPRLMLQKLGDQHREMNGLIDLLKLENEELHRQIEANRKGACA